MPTTPPRSAAMARKQSTKPPDPANDPPGEKLKRLVESKRKGRTDAEIAEAAGMRPGALSRLLNGGVPDPRLSTITSVLKAIGSNLCEFERA